MKFEEKVEIEIRLKNRESIRKISREIGVKHTTISREIMKYKTIVKNSKCIELKSVLDKEILENHPCEILTNSPYVCNGCPRYTNNHCTHHYIVYKANIAQNQYIKIKSNSNSLNTKRDRELIIELQKGLDLNQPVSHLHTYLKEKYKEDMVSVSTIYNWVKAGVLVYNKKKIRQRNINKTTENQEYKKRRDLLKEREYTDFLNYVSKNNCEYCEIDLICGPVGTNGYILTIFIPRIQFLLAFKLENKTPQAVIQVFDDIEDKIGFRMFKKLFGAILTDRGSEFLKFNEIELSKKNLKRRTRIFYCDAGTPTQKPFIENIHRLLRRVYPKGKSLENVTQEDLYEVVSNINSLKKKSFNNKSPNDMFVSHFSKTLLSKLSLREYKPEEVVLKPSSR